MVRGEKTSRDWNAVSDHILDEDTKIQSLVSLLTDVENSDTVPTLHQG